MMCYRTALAFVVFVFLFGSYRSAEHGVRMGINYGRLGDNLLQPKEAISVIKRLNFGMVKVFDADAQVLQALAGSGLRVLVMIPNQLIPEIAESQASADSWVKQNVVEYYPKTEITTVLVGNEILSDASIRDSTWPKLVPAMERIQTALEKNQLADAIKVSTPVAADAFSNTFPPSAGEFKEEISTSVMKPLLGFLSRTSSFYCANLYPYLAWASNTGDISLDYALFGSSKVVVRDREFGYTNLLDAMTDATLAAMEKLGYGSVDFAICETGWPSDGGVGASVSNAARYNNGLIRKTLSSQGTPRRSGFIPAFIFALFNENLKPGAATERYWGVTRPNGEPVYELEALGTAGNSTGKGEGDENTGKAKRWCVANPSARLDVIQAGLDYACGNGGDCGLIREGSPCFLPDNLIDHASYAFSSYWSKTKSSGGTCNFGGSAQVIEKDPSYGDCRYPATT